MKGIPLKLQEKLGDAVIGVHDFRGDETVIVKR